MSKLIFPDTVELYFTVAFDVEILWRMAAAFPDWRSFFMHRHNLLDLTLVVATTIIQIPGINGSRVYTWLTIFQLARFYRVILFVPRMKPLLVREPIELLPLERGVHIMSTL